MKVTKLSFKFPYCNATSTPRERPAMYDVWSNQFLWIFKCDFFTISNWILTFVTFFKKNNFVCILLRRRLQIIKASGLAWSGLNSCLESLELRQTSITCFPRLYNTAAQNYLHSILAKIFVFQYIQIFISNLNVQKLWRTEEKVKLLHKEAISKIQNVACTVE